LFVQRRTAAPRTPDAAERTEHSGIIVRSRPNSAQNSSERTLQSRPAVVVSGRGL
jgi:hypothetical protein